ncbi:MAG: 2-dehydropantoate 2-reductase [Sutterellaceae bacterium]|nr:2-dehydropantoate 2-reductase [Sutterellaceae bacterium]
MTQQNFHRIAVIGMGALGIMYADLLSRALPEGTVTVVADRDRIERYQRSAVTANGQTCNFSFATPETYGAPADLILFGVKATALDAAIELARPITDANTVLVSLLNGISSEEIIEEKLQKGVMLYCVAQGMDALRVGTTLTYENKGVLCLGLPPKTQDCPKAQEALKRVESLLDACEIPYVHEDDILRRQWCKWMMNVGINQVVMVHKGTFKDVQAPGSIRDEFVAAMREVIAVADKAGVRVTEDDLNEYLRLADSLNPDGMPSMRQDGLAKRASEVELFSGTVIRKAEALGVEVPVNRALYAKVKEIESTY